MVIYSFEKLFQTTDVVPGITLLSLKITPALVGSCSFFLGFQLGLL